MRTIAVIVIERDVMAPRRLDAKLYLNGVGSPLKASGATVSDTLEQMARSVDREGERQEMINALDSEEDD